MTKKSVGLSAARSLQTNYQLKPLTKQQPLEDEEGRRVPTPPSSEQETAVQDEDEDDFFDEDDDDEVVEYKYVLNSRKSAMDLINTVDDFTDRSALFSSAFMAVPVSRKSKAYKSDFVPRKFGVITGSDFVNVFQQGKQSSICQRCRL